MKVKSIEYAGGACPYQAEGTLEDGRNFYIRYRGGNLTLRVWDFEKSGIWAENSLILSEKIGEDLEGWANNDIFHKILDPIIEFPEGFVFQYGK